MSANPDLAPAELVLEAGIGLLDSGADPESHAAWFDMAGRTATGQLLLELPLPARVDIDDRNMAKAFACLVDPSP